MAWNEPPSNKNGENNPWGNKNQGGPPNIDEIIRKLQKKFNNFFSTSPSSSGSGNGNGNGNVSALPLLIVIIILAVLWCTFDSFYAIDEQERGVVLRFGEHVADLPPGLSLRFPRPIEYVKKVNVGQVRSITHTASMLTQDENIVDIEVAVQWKVKSPVDYLFNVYNPADTLKQVIESAIREVIGKGKLDFILTEGRSEIAQKQEILIQEVMDSYDSGITIAKVEMQSAKPPEQVKGAFDDAIKAREDEQTSVNQAEAYRNDVIPRARGAAARLREEANSYKSRITSKAEGEASRFEQLLTEYQYAPEVTRQRLYLDAIESMLANSSKVFSDSENNNNLLYLPIDKLMQENNVRGNLRSLSTQSDSDLISDEDGNASLNIRNRGVR